MLPIFLFLLLLFSCTPTYRVLLVNGQNNHKKYTDFEEINRTLKLYISQPGIFELTEVTCPKGGNPDYHPDFSKYDVVLSNYNGAMWPEETREDFEKYMRKGGGLVTIHSADNSFATWDEYTRMLGIGYRDRTLKGPMVYYNDEGELIRDDGEGKSHHGTQHDLLIKIRQPDHPITEGMPEEWLHAKDELYSHMRGPAENMEVLATAYSAEETRGSGRHEPVMITVRYGKGRVFHNPLGHSDYSQKCVGFKTTLLRSLEWAASGKVTQPIPENFPTQEEISLTIEVAQDAE